MERKRKETPYGSHTVTLFLTKRELEILEDLERRWGVSRSQVFEHALILASKFSDSESELKRLKGK